MSEKQIEALKAYIRLYEDEIRDYNRLNLSAIKTKRILDNCMSHARKVVNKTNEIYNGLVAAYSGQNTDPFRNTGLARANATNMMRELRKQLDIVDYDLKDIDRRLGGTIKRYNEAKSVLNNYNNMDSKE